MVKLRDLLEYFYRFPYLPHLMRDDVLRDAIVRGVGMGLFELALKEGERYPTVWRHNQPPQERDIHFAEHYVLARVGYVPRT